ncbi:MAG TPA: DUF4304 domain-containing protein [Gemmataceae bacterium]|nr:DUF4304 domain-containing protein [Gemmataceae bacterium]
MGLAEWKKLVTAPVAATLKRRGFRKSGLIFTAARNDVVLMVGLQSSQGSTKDQLKITCNLGIWVEQFARRPKPDIWECRWHNRIGQYLPEPTDYWWICSSDESASKAGHEIATLLEDRGLPEMESLASLPALEAMWSKLGSVDLPKIGDSAI